MLGRKPHVLWAHHALRLGGIWGHRDAESCLLGAVRAVSPGSLYTSSAKGRRCLRPPLPRLQKGHDDSTSSSGVSEGLEHACVGEALTHMILQHGFLKYIY